MNALAPVDLLGVLDQAIEREKAAGQSYVAQVAGRAALEELIAAAQPFVRHNSSEPTFNVTHLNSADVTRLRAAIFGVGGAA